MGGSNTSKKTKLHTKRISTKRKSTTLPISAGKSGIWFDNRLWDQEVFFVMAVTTGARRLCVLTNREYLQIVEPASFHGLKIDIFEINFPIFSDIKYSSSPRTNYNVLIKHLRKIEKLGINSKSLSKHLSNSHMHTALKKARFKNDYDRHFFFAYKDGYQEVFKLKEERPDRVIIALDFNSMYLDSMKGDFCDPSSIKYKNFQGLPINTTSLANGIYRVRLQSAKKSFLLDHHPFRYKRLGRSYYFKMSCGDTVETLLHKNEIEYFSSFFESTEIIEGLFSCDTIEHPLLCEGLNLYSQRMYHKRRGDRVKESLCKASIQHMHSSTNQKRFSKKNFDSLEQVRDFVSTMFLIDFNTLNLEEITDFLCRHKYFELVRTSQEYQLNYLNIDANENIYSLSAQVVANARLKMLKTLEQFLSYPSVELCYVNIDSVHLSIHRDEVNRFLQQNSDLISEQLGALKIEAIADQGYWFDVGRYWLKKKSEIVLFKNKGFNHKATTCSFVCSRKVSNFIETPTFSYLRTNIMKIENSFTYHKRLEHQTPQESHFDRFRYEEISEISTANLTEAHEQLRSMKDKVKLFQRISNKGYTKKSNI